MIELPLFSNQPAERGRTVWIEPLAVVDVTEAECKRRIDWLRHTWVPVVMVEMMHGGVHVVEDYDRTTKCRIEAAKRAERRREQCTHSD